MIYSPNVEFCGYSIPHPSEALMNIRIQTYGQYNCPHFWHTSNYLPEGSAVEALEKGLNDLIVLCDIVAEKFIDARAELRDEMET